MSRPACMTEQEWADWNAPFEIVNGADRDRFIRLPPPTGHPCFDCPVAFHLEQRAAGTCDGWPMHAGRRRLQYAPEHAIERRRQQWREAAARRRARAVA